MQTKAKPRDGGEVSSFIQIPGGPYIILYAGDSGGVDDSGWSDSREFDSSSITATGSARSRRNPNTSE